LKFYASVRLEVTRVGSIKKGEEAIGNRTRVKVVKNKVAPPFRQTEFEIYYGEGVSMEAELGGLGVETGIVRKSGSWYALDDERLGQGKENVREYLAEHPGLAERIRAHVMSHYGIGLEPPVQQPAVQPEA